MVCQSGRSRARSFLQPEGNVDRFPGEGLNEDLEPNWKQQQQLGHVLVGNLDIVLLQSGMQE